MGKLCLSFLCLAACAFGQYKTEPAGPPPSELSAGIAGQLNKDGVKVMGPNGLLYEIWLVSTLPSGAKSTEENLTLPEVPHGSLMGAIRVTVATQDRRSQNMKPGVYTLRYSYYPVNGAHQGVAPQRDFLVLSKAADDKDGKAAPDFKTLIAAGQKASGSNHPNVLSMWKVDSDFAAGFAKQGEHDWVWQTKIGSTPLAVILIGQADA